MGSAWSNPGGVTTQAWPQSGKYARTANARRPTGRSRGDRATRMGSPACLRSTGRSVPRIPSSAREPPPRDRNRGVSWSGCSFSDTQQARAAQRLQPVAAPSGQDRAQHFMQRAPAMPSTQLLAGFSRPQCGPAARPWAASNRRQPHSTRWNCSTRSIRCQRSVSRTGTSCPKHSHRQPFSFQSCNPYRIPCSTYLLQPTSVTREGWSSVSRRGRPSTGPAAPPKRQVPRRRPRQAGSRPPAVARTATARSPRRGLPPPVADNVALGYSSSVEAASCRSIPPV